MTKQTRMTALTLGVSLAGALLIGVSPATAADKNL